MNSDSGGHWNRKNQLEVHRGRSTMRNVEQSIIIAVS